LFLCAGIQSAAGVTFTGKVYRETNLDGSASASVTDTSKSLDNTAVGATAADTFDESPISLMKTYEDRAGDNDRDWRLERHVYDQRTNGSGGIYRPCGSRLSRLWTDRSNELMNLPD